MSSTSSSSSSSNIGVSDVSSCPTRAINGPTTPRKGPPKFKQRMTRHFKSKPPKKGVKGFGDEIPGMEGLGNGNVFQVYPGLYWYRLWAAGVCPPCLERI
ncbi:retinal cone rhodopsin-sensitive cGMP 3',5'-cyclic phosphodiesterase subunit gamma-like [Astyanax mexicanus]|uniref:retinal cone rhodopsin-sensitive cGMP 3',5'-cyclic phosphodiesterase subunit gamma-like n=1 Tax=Astyanax mexicanus TaxID=7994 RepID=UPI0020CAE4CA|nr:retinal cone rhodopsin-sensitive cGMP 3',5'-cyclic phosphodiesterase subunit gamma-like [Astyanax mexicanus]